MSNIVTLGDYNKFTDLTDAVQYIPNKWGRIGEMGLFTPRGTPQLSVTFDRVDNTLTALDAVTRGTKPQYGGNEVVKTYSYATAFFAANDRVDPADVQGRRRPGSAADTDTVTEAVARKLENLRRAHAITREYMEMQAIKGLVKSPNGVTFANLYTDFDFNEKQVDFLLGTNSTDVDGKIREVVRHIEDNSFNGGSMTGIEIRILVSQAFFDKLIAHDNVREAYMYYQATNQMSGAQPLRDDMRRTFRHQGVVFEEYRASIKKMNGTSEVFITANEGHAFPVGVDGMFETWFSPAHHMDYVNTIGEELYAWSLPERDGSGLEIFSQSSIIPLCKSPQALVKVKTSN